MPDGWSITESAFDPALARAYEGLFTQGSGYLHVRGSLEEHLFDAPQNLDYTRRPANVTAEKFLEMKARWGTFIPGVRGNHPLLNRSLVNLPFFLDLVPYVGGEKLDMQASAIEGYTRRLDLRAGVLHRSFQWRTRQGALLAAAFERFVSAAIPQVCVQRLSLSTDQDVVVTVRAGIDADVRTFGYDMFTQATIEPASKNGVSCQATTNTGDRVWLLTQLSPREAAWQYEGTGRAGRLGAEFHLPAGGSLVVEKRTAAASSFDLERVSPGDVLDRVSEFGYEELLAAHRQVWEQRWAKADVIIDGDEAAQLAVRAALYHLLRAHPGDSRLSIDPKGYAGDAYRGCYFWDTEIYMLPFFIYTDPDLARALLEYRIHSLPGARANAAQSGYRGARFAWEADVDGTETCPNWQYRDHEIHVTADIAYAMDHYALAAQDEEFLEQSAAPLIVETARFWMDRLDYREGEDHPNLLGVMGPDEYTPLSNNNSFTNRMAAHALALAARLAPAGGANEAEAAQFAAAAERLPMPRSADGRLVLQCEDFNRWADPDWERFWSDRSRPLAAFAPQEWLYRWKCLKQADVLLLMMLFPSEYSEEEVRCAWEYYLPYTTHDSSLSPGVHAIMAARLGKMEEAWAFWERCSQLDLDAASGGAAEGMHMANAGLNWQMAVFGFGGLSTAMEAEIPTFQPRLPASWKRLTFPLAWKGSRLAVEIRPEQVVIANRGTAAQEVSVRGVTQPVAPGQSAIFQIPS